MMAIPDRADVGAGVRRGAGVVVAGFCVAGGVWVAGAGVCGAGAGVAGFCVAGAGFCCAGVAGACANVSQVMRPARRQLNNITFRISSIIVPTVGIIPDGRQGYPGK